MMKESDLSLEIELKLQLGSFTNYLKLVGHLGALDSEQHHINGFFDSEGRELANDGWALRVRAESDRGLVTLKSANRSQGSAAIREEIEAEITRAVAMEVLNLRIDPLDIPVPPIDFVRSKFPEIALAKIVQFENNRQIKSYQIGDHTYMLEIDKTEFGDGLVDYELEIEMGTTDTVEIVKDKIGRLFASLDIPFIIECKSKFQRALERLRS